MHAQYSTYMVIFNMRYNLDFSLFPLYTHSKACVCLFVNVDLLLVARFRVRHINLILCKFSYARSRHAHFPSAGELLTILVNKHVFIIIKNYQSETSKAWTTTHTHTFWTRWTICWLLAYHYTFCVELNNAFNGHISVWPTSPSSRMHVTENKCKRDFMDQKNSERDR